LISGDEVNKKVWGYKGSEGKGHKTSKQTVSQWRAMKSVNKKVGQGFTNEREKF